ncbi:uncharacterized [Tachysurus ichikawai]
MNHTPTSPSCGKVQLRQRVPSMPGAGCVTSPVCQEECAASVKHAFGERIRGRMCTHVCTVTCQCTSPFSPAGCLTSCLRGAKAFGSLSLPTREKERKSGNYTGRTDTRGNKE